MARPNILSIFILALLLALYLPLIAQLPPLFNDQLLSQDWGFIVGLTFDEDGDMYVWDKAGKVFVVKDGKKVEEPLIDISEEVLNYGDHGMLGFALHPNFLNNGYFYLLYAVDQHYLLYAGTSSYSPTTTTPEVATIGRVTRYTADPASAFTTTIPESRKVLIGERKDTGIPLLHKSHGVGSLVFGADGTLMVSSGDGASYVNTGDFGSNPDSFFEEALALGLIDEVENVGAYRSQLLASLNGKLLRIDPNTGDGIPSNPFYDAANPRAAQSRVWALGLRNPYRFSLKPGTGSHDAAAGNPGVFYIGDVGWGRWEEINVAKFGGQNFGWPIYEGNNGLWNYTANPRPHPFAPNPLFGQAGCDKEYLTFHDLLIQETLEANPFYSNPCDTSEEIPEGYPRFMHVRPTLAWSNRQFNPDKQGAEVPAFDTSGQAIIYDLGSADSVVVGEGFSGSCTVGGIFYTAENFPEEYYMSYIAGDYPGWMRKLEYDSDDKLLQVSPFMDDVDKLNLVHIELGPTDGCLYYISYAPPRSIRKICYGGNPPPTSIIRYDRQYGPSPLRVQFQGNQSFDPQGQSISWLWDFGDGVQSIQTNPIHSFQAPDGEPTAFEVSLTVTDSLGAYHTSSSTISVNNTPPSIAFTSFQDGDMYKAGQRTNLPLIAEVSDEEHIADELSYAWYLYLHHNTHNHPERPDESVYSKMLISGEGCGDEDFWYRVGLEVRDAAGLSTRIDGELFPYCGEALAEFELITVSPHSTYINVSWKNKKEASNTTFVIERAKEDLIFRPIGQREAKGAGTLYEFNDLSPIKGVSFYRVAALTDQVREYSPSKQVDFPPPPPVLVYPNPARDELNIVLLEVEGSAQFDLYNSLGSHLLRSKADENTLHAGQWKIMLNAIQGGIYMYRISYSNKNITAKIVIEKR